MVQEIEGGMYNYFKSQAGSCEVELLGNCY